MIIIHHRDITDIDEGYHPDCIVNASNPELTCGGGVSGAIHRAVGQSDLEREAGGIHMIGTGSAVLQTGANLTNWVIQTVAPRKNDKYRVDDGYWGWREQLEQCYWNCLQLAVSANKPNGPVEFQPMPLESIAFPMLGTGAYGLPWEEADGIAYKTCRKFDKWCRSEPLILGYHLTIHLVIGPHSEDGEERYRRLELEAHITSGFKYGNLALPDST